MTLEILDIGEALTQQDGNVLYALANLVAHPDAIFIEIGSWKGYSTTFIGTVAKKCDGHVYCVDHWQGSPGVWFHNLEADCFSKFRHNMNGLGLAEVVHPLVMPSAIASRIFSDAIADMVFIDADHRYESVKQDLGIWYPKVKKGGVFCGHDADGYWHNYTKEQQEVMNNSLEKDWCDEVHTHAGVAKALFEFFDDKYTIKEGTRVWCREKE